MINVGPSAYLYITPCDDGMLFRYRWEIRDRDKRPLRPDGTPCGSRSWELFDSMHGWEMTAFGASILGRRAYRRMKRRVKRAAKHKARETIVEALR